MSEVDVAIGLERRHGWGDDAAYGLVGHVDVLGLEGGEWSDYSGNA